MKALIFIAPLHLGQSRGSSSKTHFIRLRQGYGGQVQAAQVRVGGVIGSGSDEIGCASRLAPRALAERVPK